MGIERLGYLEGMWIVGEIGLLSVDGSIISYSILCDYYFFQRWGDGDGDRSLFVCLFV